MPPGRWFRPILTVVGVLTLVFARVVTERRGQLLVARVIIDLLLAVAFGVLSTAPQAPSPASKR